MPADKNTKSWRPAQFTLASERVHEPDSSRGHAVVILNQPLNKELLVQLCRGGSLRASVIKMDAPH